MAASPNPLQGSLFQSQERASVIDAKENQSSNNSSEKLTNQALKDDANLRPRSKQTKNTQNQINNLDELSIPRLEEPQWNHHSLPNIDDLTPALRHYVELKIENPNRILLYRLGDFFECFFEDAITLSELLELTLTSKEGGKKIGRIPMAGIPHHASDRYCTQVIKKGLGLNSFKQLLNSFAINGLRALGSSGECKTFRF